MQYKPDCLRYLYYTTGNISDVDHIMLIMRQKDLSSVYM